MSVLFSRAVHDHAGLCWNGPFDKLNHKRWHQVSGMQHSNVGMMASAVESATATAGSIRNITCSFASPAPADTHSVFAVILRQVSCPLAGLMLQEPSTGAEVSHRVQGITPIRRGVEEETDTWQVCANIVPQPELAACWHGRKWGGNAHKA